MAIHQATVPQKLRISVNLAILDQRCNYYLKFTDTKLKYVKSPDEQTL